MNKDRLKILLAFLAPIIIGFVVIPLLPARCKTVKFSKAPITKVEGVKEILDCLSKTQSKQMSFPGHKNQMWRFSALIGPALEFEVYEFEPVGKPLDGFQQGVWHQTAMTRFKADGSIIFGGESPTVALFKEARDKALNICRKKLLTSEDVS